MNAILSTIAKLADSLDDRSPASGRSGFGRTFLLVCGGGLICLVGVGFALAGCHELLARELDPWLASLVLGLALLLVGSATILVARANRAEEREKRSQDPNSDLGEEIGKLLARSGVGPTELTIASLVAGLVFGASPKLRRDGSANGRDR
jgi:hypothetical protein